MVNHIIQFTVWQTVRAEASGAAALAVMGPAAARSGHGRFAATAGPTMRAAEGLSPVRIAQGQADRGGSLRDAQRIRGRPAPPPAQRPAGVFAGARRAAPQPSWRFAAAATFRVRPSSGSAAKRLTCQ